MRLCFITPGGVVNVACFLLPPIYILYSMHPSEPSAPTPCYLLAWC